MIEEIQNPSDIQTRRRVFHLSVWREIAVFAVITMELSWAALWYRLFINFNQEISYWRAFIILGGMLYATYWAARVMNSLDLSMTLRRLVLLVLLFVFIFVGFRVLQYPDGGFSIQEVINRIIREFRNLERFIPFEFVILFTITIVWWRGIAYSAKKADPESVLGGFRTGIYLLLLYGALFTLAYQPSPFALYLLILELKNSQKLFWKDIFNSLLFVTLSLLSGNDQ